MSNDISSISINPAFEGVFNKAVGLLFQADAGLLGQVDKREIVVTAFEAACEYCPSVKTMPFPKDGIGRRRAISYVSQIWLSQQEVEA